MKNKILLFYLVCFLLLIENTTHGQSVNNYVFSTTNTGSLSLDRNGNAVDMSAGTKTLVYGGVNDGASTLANIGFDFYFMGNRQVNFSVNDNGVLRLGAICGSSENAIGANGQNRICPFSNNLSTSSLGKVHYKVVGTAPYRCLVVEWKNMTIDKSSTTVDGTFQARLYETTGVIEFVYGTMNVGTGSSTTGYQIGFSSSNTSTKWLSLLSTTNSLITTGTIPSNTYSVGTISDLNSTTDGSRKTYTFTSPIANAPTAGSITNVTTNNMKLNWTRNSTNELQFEIYYSYDGINYFYFGKSNAGTSSLTCSNLKPSTKYYWKMCAITEGAISSWLDLGSATTLSPTLNTFTGCGGKWSITTNWSLGRVPNSGDNVVIPAGCSVIVDASGNCNNLVVDGTLTYANVEKITLTVVGNLIVSSTGTIQKNNDNISQVLKIQGDLTVDGTLSMLPLSTTYSSSSIGNVYFYGYNNSTIFYSASNTVCNLGTLTIDKGIDMTSYSVETQRTIALATPTTTGRYLNVVRGTFILSSPSYLTPFYGNTNINDATGRLRINYPSAFVGCTPSDNGSLSAYGDLEINAGTFTNYGDFATYANLSINNGGVLNAGDGSKTFTISNGGNLLINGGTLNQNGRVQTSANTQTMTMTSGLFNVNPQYISNLSAGDVFSLGSLVNVNFSGGTLTIVNPNANKGTTNNEFIVSGTTGAKNFIGSTIRFGNGNSTKAGYTGRGFSMSIPSDILLDNVIIDNNASTATTGREVYLKSAVNINNLSLTNTNASLKINNNTLNIKQNITNNGIIDGSIATSKIFFNGSSPQIYSGSGSINASNLSVTVDNTAGLTLNAPFNTKYLILNNGIVTNDITNLLIVSGTNETDAKSNSSSSYVNGFLAREIPNSSTKNYLFPVGNTQYNPIQLNITSNTNTTTIIANVTNNTPTGNGDSGLRNPISNAENVFWDISVTNPVAITALNSVGLVANVTNPPVKQIGMINAYDDNLYQGIGYSVAGNMIVSNSDIDETRLYNKGNTRFIIAESTPLNTTYTVGVGGDYLNLTAIAQALRDKTVDNYVYFEMLPTYDYTTETFPISFTQYATSNPNWTVTIRPSAAVTTIETLGNSNSVALISLDGIKQLTFDGRPKGSTNAIWKFTNTNTSYPTFEFKNGTSLDTLKYIKVQSSNNLTTTGAIQFGLSNTVSGNSCNVISNCDINGAYNGIYALGTAGKVNAKNIISDCTIHDFFNTSGNSNGIFISDNNTNYTIKNNHIYQTSNKTFTSNGIYSGIRIDMTTNGDNFIISANVIDATVLSGVDAQMMAMYLKVGNNNYKTTTVVGNTIKNIKLNTSYNGNGTPLYGAFSAIYTPAGKLNIKENIIGSIYDNDNISCTYSGTNGYMYGINTLGTDSLWCESNQIGGLTAFGASSNLYIRPVLIGNASGNCVLNNNTIGSPTLSNNIRAGIVGTTTITDITVIYSLVDKNVQINKNTIANISSFGAGTGCVRGIYSPDGSNTITQNLIYNLSTYSSSKDSVLNAAVIGIAAGLNTASQSIEYNTIYNLSLKNTTAAGKIVGIIHQGTGSTSRNNIHSFYNVSKVAEQTGILLANSSNATVKNNFVRLGVGTDYANRIYGISNLSNQGCQIYFNSVYIGGTNMSTVDGQASFAFFSDRVTKYTLKNNIFVNNRKNANPEPTVQLRNYVVSHLYPVVIESDYNIYYAANGAILANLNIENKYTIRDLKVYTNMQDLHSGYGDPNFLNPEGDASTVDLHLKSPTPAYRTGSLMSSISEDINGSSTRTSNPTNIGADNNTYTLTSNEDIFVPNFDYTPIKNIPSPQDVSITVTITDQGTGLDLSKTPVMYFRRMSSTIAANIEKWNKNRYIVGTLISKNSDNTESQWSFKMSTTTPSPSMAMLDIYEYYFVAQDRSSSTSSSIGYSTFDELTPIHKTVIADATTSFPSNNEVNYFGVGSYMGGNYDVPGDFPSLTGAGGFFEHLNASFATADVIANITADIVEPATYPLNALNIFPVGSNFVAKVVPKNATLKVLSCTANKEMIRLEGATNALFDGRFNGAGNYLKFAHQNDLYSTFYFKDDAQNNIIRNCKIENSTSLQYKGAIVFGEGISLGNNKNSILNNEIKNNTTQPWNLIYNFYFNTTNSDNTISGNQLSNYAYNGVWLPTGCGDNWTISDNSLFNNYAASTDGSIGIHLDAGNNHLIANNTIGGNAADNSGTWTISGSQNFALVDMDKNTGIRIKNNTIQNITITSNSNVYPIYMSASKAGTATIEYNKVQNLNYGSTTGEIRIFNLNPSSVAVNYNTFSDITVAGDRYFYCIFLNTASTSTTDGNLIKKVTMAGTNSYFRGIFVSAGVALIGTNASNTIGGLSSTDAIQYAGKNTAYGIYINSGVSANKINNNLIANVNATNTYANVNALELKLGTTTTSTIENNSIRDCKLTGTGAKFNALYLESGLATINNNSIDNISNSGTETDGIFLSSGAVTTGILVSNNQISRFTSAKTINGMYSEASQDYQFLNNTISNFTTNATNFSGITINAGTNVTINNNAILSVTLNSSSAVFYGFNISKGLVLSGTLGATNTIASIQNKGTETDGIIIYGCNPGTVIQNTIIKDIDADNGAIGININNTGDNVVVTDNTISNLISYSFVKGIFQWASQNNITIQSNKIQNFNTTRYLTFSAIEVLNGKANVLGNTISNITITGTGDINPILISSSNSDSRVLNNSITNISGNGRIFGINNTGNAANMSNNDISLLTCNGNSDVTIINTVSSTDITINNNRINTIVAKGTGGLLCGIFHNGSGIATISNNDIHALSTNGNSTSLWNEWVLAKCIFSTSGTISSNTIYGITATNTTAATHIIGIIAKSDKTITTIEKNTIYDLQNKSNNASTNGILTSASNYNLNIYNNMISLGNGLSTSIINGIRTYHWSSKTVNVYHNTVYINGNGTANSFAFSQNDNTPVKLLNNIFHNVRTGGNHFAINSESGLSFNSNYNDLYSETTIGKWNSSIKTLTTWQTASSGDAKSISLLVNFKADVNSADLHVDESNNCGLNGRGTFVLATDFDNETRRTTRPDIGADEFQPTGGNDADTWIGVENTRWDWRYNWACDLVPTTTTDVTIEVSSNQPIINVDVAIKKLTVQSGTELTINPLKSLTLSGDLILNNGKITVKSDATGTGSLLDNGVITGSGTAIAERYAAAGKFHYVSSPVPDALLTTLTVTNYGAKNPNIYYYNEPIKDNWVDNRNYGWTVPTSKNLEIGKGYTFWINYTIANPIKGTSFNTGTIVNPVTYTKAENNVLFDGWNLIGNPYPSGVDGEKFLNANPNIEQALYFWDDDSSNGADYTSSDYAVWNRTGYIGGGNGHIPTGLIAVAQGFCIHYIKAVGSTNVTFNNTMRLSEAGKANSFFKSGTDMERSWFSVINPSKQYNEILIAFSSFATDDFDRDYDAVKMKGNANFALYSKLNTLDYAIQTLAKLNETHKSVDVNVGLLAKVAGVYTFNMQKLDNFDDRISIELEDLTTKQIVDLRQSSYVFNSEVGTFDSRFILHFNLSRKNNTISSETTNESKTFETQIYSYKNQAVVQCSKAINGNVLVYNVLGQLIDTHTITSDKLSFTVPNTGIYVIKVVSDKINTQQKVFITND